MKIETLKTILQIVIYALMEVFDRFRNGNGNEQRKK